MSVLCFITCLYITGGKKPYRGNMKRGRQDNKTKEEPPVKQAKSDTQE